MLAISSHLYFGWVELGEREGEGSLLHSWNFSVNLERFPNNKRENSDKKFIEIICSMYEGPERQHSLTHG